MAYTAGPYALSLPPTGAPAPVEARKIDFVSKDYVPTAEGGHESMPATAQRVLLLISFASGEDPKFITAQGLRAQEDRIRKALSVLTSGRDPAISNLVVRVERRASGHVGVVVDFFDNLEGKQDSVTY